jgi:RHS repeat-associated protein
VYFEYYTSGAAAGQLMKVTSPAPYAGAPMPVDSLWYDAAGNLAGTRSPLGFLTVVDRDALGRVTDTYSPLHADSSSTEAHVRAKGVRQRVWYDAMDRDTLTQSVGPTVRVAWSELEEGTTTLTSVPQEMVTVRTVRDAEGRPLRVERWATPDTAGVGVLATVYEYDRAGRVLMEREDPGPGMIKEYAYDPAGNVITSTDALFQQLSMRYDAANRLTRRVTPGTYTAPTSADCSTEYVTCSFSFPKFPNTTAGGWQVPADTAWFGYDHAGRMLWAENGDAIVQRSYHPSGALHTDTLRIRAYSSHRFDLHVYGLRYGYDASGRMKWLEHPSNLAGTAQRDTFAYDATTGALQTVGSRTGLAFGYAYDLLGRLATESYPGGQNVYTYDVEGRQTGRTGAYTESYTHDARGKVLSATVAQPGTSTSTSTFYNHYSGLGMLVATDWTNVSNSARNIEEMVVDALGHVRWRRKANSETWVAPEHTYVYDEGSSRVMEIGFTYPPVVWDTAAFSPDTTFRSYDPAGNVRAGWENYWGLESDHQSYRMVHTRSYWGSDGKLRAQQGYDEQGIFFMGERHGYFSEHRYDALGRRVLVRTRRDDLCNTIVSTVDCSSGIERFVWSGDNILWEMRGPGSESATVQQLEQAVGSGVEYGLIGYTHAGEVDRPLVVWKGSGGATSDVVVPHLNWRGLFGRGTNANGDPTGITIEWPGFQTSAYHKMGPTQLQTRTWMGSIVKGQRGAGGQMYMRNRYYDPATGQFTQPDPIGIAGGLNVYGFAAGDPVSYSDPYGLSAMCCTFPLKSPVIRVGVTIALMDGPQPGPADLVAVGVVGLALGGAYLRNRHIQGRIEGEVGVIEEHFGKLAGAGSPGSGDPNDPRNRDKWKDDIRRHIREMGRQIDRLVGERNKAPWREQLQRIQERLDNVQE